MAEFCILQIRKYPFTEKFLKFTVWRGASRVLFREKGDFALKSRYFEKMQVR